MEGDYQISTKLQFSDTNLTNSPTSAGSAIKSQQGYR